MKPWLNDRLINTAETAVPHRSTLASIPSTRTKRLETVNHLLRVAILTFEARRILEIPLGKMRTGLLGPESPPHRDGSSKPPTNPRKKAS